jgi:hypothetical protein
MNAAADLLTELCSLGVELIAGGDRLRVKAPPGAVTAALRERITTAKPELLRLLAANQPRLPRVWRCAVDGRGMTIIDPSRRSSIEMLRDLEQRFGAHRIGRLVLVEQRSSGSGEGGGPGREAQGKNRGGPAA